MEKSLENKHCQPCESNTPPLDAKEVTEYMAQIPDWKANNEKTEIHRKFTFKNFYHTMSFVNALAHIANREGHHPDFKVGYNYCVITFSTHAIKGLSINDFICAKKVDRLL